ncbi:Phage integrase family protein [Nocardia amikacinitolerans]|uniref:tyrosine-type recombinase/integrase n=1 Tax=Nocardia amikacinitolerans TaxID=756689 RepID=UPI00082CBB60|nr:tyrosine-type recombinase/integrase [Nocardia amikacinitolerans]MCP2320970.1 Phage integrase family protein [Nocardia amikacinitolerans]
MPRPATELGSYGDIGTKQKHDGTWRAWATFRGYDGKGRLVDAHGPTESKAKTALRKKLAARQKQYKGRARDKVTRDTRLSVLMDMWLTEVERDEGVDRQSYDLYQGEIEVSTDKRAKKDAIKLRPALGNLRVWEADAGRLDEHIQSVAGAGMKSKARLHKVILTGIMGLAVRYGALSENPVRDTSRLRRRKTKPQIIERDRLVGLREQLRQWLAGEEIPGTPAYTHGPKRDQFVVDVADLILGSGVRPGEALAASWDQFDLEAEPATFTIDATVVRLKGKGLFRQEWTKTDAGHRTVALPGFAVDMLKRLQGDPGRGRMCEVRALREVRGEVVEVNDQTALVFPGRGGVLRDPHNFNRTWRAARGTIYKDVTQYTFRKTVATLIAEGSDARTAAKQLGHAREGITERHYIASAEMAPDSSAVLEKGLGRAS